MASESSTERTLSITLPAALDEWLDEHAGAAGVEREQLLLQLLAAYRETTKATDDPESELVVVDEDAIGEAVDSQLEERIDARVQSALDGAVTDRLTEATSSVQRQLSNRIDGVEDDFDEKIADVGDRVIQVKKETDAKAPPEHTHEKLDRIPDLAGHVEDLETRLEDLEKEFEDAAPDEASIDDVDGRLDRLEDRLQTVAWIVSDLREAHESDGGLETVERIKRAAAKADIERATCENCGDGVTISLLTDPECPHCEAAVTNVEPGGGWFSKPKLLTAAQLESGEDR